jgi:hypothetical protein
MAVTTDAAARDLAELAANLRDLGDRGLQKDLRDAIRRAAATIPPVVRAGLAQYMPDRYAAVLNPDLDMGSSTRTTGTDIGVSVYVRPRGLRKRKLPRLDFGILAHPLFGDRERWFYQELPSVQSGFFSDPVEDAEPRVRADIEAAVSRIRDEVWKGV